MAEQGDIREKILGSYKKYILTRAGVGIPFLLIAFATFVNCITHLDAELNIPLYFAMLVCIMVIILSGTEAYRFLFWFRPEKCKKLLFKEPEKMEYIGMEKHWILGWKLEFGSYGAETYRIIGKKELVWPYFRALADLNKNCPIKFPDEMAVTFNEEEKNLLMPRRVDRPTVSY